MRQSEAFHQFARILIVCRTYKQEHSTNNTFGEYVHYWRNKYLLEACSYYKVVEKKVLMGCHHLLGGSAGPG